jgi:hypothetical protein
MMSTSLNLNNATWQTPSDGRAAALLEHHHHHHLLLHSSTSSGNNTCRRGLALALHI